MTRCALIPVMKMVAGRLPEAEALASQPTLSRFESSVAPASLRRLVDFLIDTGIKRLKQEHAGSVPASLKLDLDAADDPTHGQQQMALFQGYFDQHQYFPLIIGEPPASTCSWPGCVPVPCTSPTRPTKGGISGVEAFCAKLHYRAPFGLLITENTEGRLGEFTIALPASTFLLVG